MARLVRDGADVVAGSRYVRGGRQEGGPLLKRILSRLAGMSLHYLAGLPIHDATNNFRAYSRRVVEQIPIEGEASFAVALELTLKAHWRGWQLAEVPTTWRDRTAGQSRFRLWAWLPHYLRWYVARAGPRLVGRAVKRRKFREVARFDQRRFAEAFGHFCEPRLRSGFKTSRERKRAGQTDTLACARGWF